MTTPIAAVGIVGLGNMGMPMAKRLVAAGYQVLGYDVSPDARGELASHGGSPVDDLAAVVRDVAIIVLMLPNSQIVDQVTAATGFRDGLRPGVTVVDMGSSEPLATRALSEDLAAVGVALVDAPVSGGVRGAVNGTLTIMTGGADDDVDRVLPVLQNLGRVVRTGPVGSGHAIKALNNLLSATHLWATSEAMVVGARFGVDPRIMLDALNGSSGRSGSTENKWPNFILPGTFDSGFGLRLMLKDMRIANDLAAELGVPSELGEFAAQRWAEAADALPTSADHTEIARWIADRVPVHAHAD